MVLSIAIATVGCDDPQDDVRVYTARIDPPAPPAIGDRMPSALNQAGTPSPLLGPTTIDPDSSASLPQPRELAWDVPTEFGFRESGETNQFRLTTLRAGDPEDADTAVELAVSRIAGQAGTITGNVNRWRQQLGLPPLSQEEVVGVVEWVGNDALSGMFTRIESDNGEAATMIAWFTLDNANWFFKANGTPEALDAHREGFDALIASVRLNADATPVPHAGHNHVPRQGHDHEPAAVSAPAPAPAY
ncbi:MAG: hypothetical protein AAGH92_00400 [Planctomycetota bacterium]